MKGERGRQGRGEGEEQGGLTGERVERHGRGRGTGEREKVEVQGKDLGDREG